MTRIKTNEIPVLATWEEVDKSIKRACQIKMAVEKAEALMQEEIDSAKDRAAKKTAAILEEKSILEKNIEDFCGYYRDRFGDKKSRELNFGTVGFRLSTKLITLKGWNWQKVAGKLKALKLTQFLIEKVSVDKDAIKKANLKDVRLKAYGLAVESKEEFYYEPDIAKIAELPNMDVAGKKAAA